MAMYYCHECQNYCDDDYNPMVEHPWRKRLVKYRDEICCSECGIELEYELEESLREDMERD